MEKTWEEFIATAAKPDGRIHAMSDVYVKWKPEEPTMCLEGNFTAEDLRKFADWMDTHKKE